MWTKRYRKLTDSEKKFINDFMENRKGGITDLLNWTSEIERQGAKNLKNIRYLNTLKQWIKRGKLT